jgi:two-component system, chemotaxis family, protein-glutamate methylesterase/glutaminase
MQQEYTPVYKDTIQTDDLIRVLVVDDTITYRKIVSDALTGIPGVEVVGSAANGRIALQKIDQLNPDLLTLDLEMPEMNGLDVLRHLKDTVSSVRAIMLSGANTIGAKMTMAALELGAFDFVLKPTGGSVKENSEMLQRELGLRIQAYSRTKHVHTILHGHAPALPHTPIATSKTSLPRPRPSIGLGAAHPEVVVLGISTGGPASLTKMLPQLPANLHVPVLIVQHMPPVFTKSLADDLNRRCALRVFEAQDGQKVCPGHILIAPGGKQMKIVKEDEQIVVRITDDPPENSCKPSVDYLFRSACQIYGKNTVGVIMTGMGNDGTRGCRDLKRLGASIIAQDEASCVVFGMPKQPIEEGIADIVAPLDSIASEIVRLVGKESVYASNR